MSNGNSTCHVDAVILGTSDRSLTAAIQIPERYQIVFRYSDEVQGLSTRTGGGTRNIPQEDFWGIAIQVSTLADSVDKKLATSWRNEG